MLDSGRAGRGLRPPRPALDVPQIGALGTGAGAAIGRLAEIGPEITLLLHIGLDPV